MRTFLGVCLLLVLWSTPAPGREIFVDNLSGNDRFNGQQPRGTAELFGPVRTIARALRLAGAGDVILLAKNKEPYRESISLVGSRHSGTAKDPFVIRGNGAILDGSVPVPARAWESTRERSSVSVRRKPATNNCSSPTGRRCRCPWVIRPISRPN